MDWLTRYHLDLKGHAQAGAFHPNQPLLAVAVGSFIIEFDALTGCKQSMVDVGGHVIRLAYSPVGGHLIVAILEDMTIKSWNLDTEHTVVLFSPPDRKADKATDVHIALTPFHPWLFFTATSRSVVNVVGTEEGILAAARIKTDVKKPVTGLACHPSKPFLYVAYSDGFIRAHGIPTFTVLYVLGLEDPEVKLLGAAAIAFHSRKDVMFVGDRSGAILGWDISSVSRPDLIGFKQLGTSAVTAVSWHATLEVLLTLTQDGEVLSWFLRAQPSQAGTGAISFVSTGGGMLDVGRVLQDCGGRPVHPLPPIQSLLFHTRINLGTIIYALDAGGEKESAQRIANMSKESRRKLLAVLQSTRIQPGSNQRDKLAVLGTAGIVSDQQIQQQLVLSRGQSRITQATMADVVRKAFLYGVSKDAYATTGPVKSVPLLTLTDVDDPLREVPVCQPFQCSWQFFHPEQGIYNYPSRAVMMDGCNLVSYNIANGSYAHLKIMTSLAASGASRTPIRMVYSWRQHALLIFFKTQDGPGEIVLHRYLDLMQPIGDGAPDTLPGLTGRDGAFTGDFDTQLAILDDDGYGLFIFPLENANVPEVPDLGAAAAAAAMPPTQEATEAAGAREPLDESTFVASAVYGFDQYQEQQEGAEEEEHDPNAPTQFLFETPVQRIFSTPLETSLLYVVAGSHIGIIQAYVDPSGRPAGDLVMTNGVALLSTKPREGRAVKLQPLETVVEVRWQEKPDGAVAGVLTTQRALIISVRMELLVATEATLDQAYPPFRGCLWAGPTLLVSSATSVAALGWDGVLRPVVTAEAPNIALLGVLNDRVLLVCRKETPDPLIAKGKLKIEVRARLTGLLEPLALGWVTLVQAQGPDPLVDLADILFQLTSRFDSLRITPRLVEVLSRGPPVCSDLALELSQSGPQFTPEMRANCAIRALRFDAALKILHDEFKRSRAYPACPPSSRLFQRFRHLGRECIKCAQFNHAKQAFELAGDNEGLFDLFIAHMNPSAMRHLVQKLEENGTDPELKRACDRLLLVRSSMWRQGGAITSLGSDSLAPKGPDWGGGNWTMKVLPEDTKPPPKWELTGELTAYMKTQGGAVPVITPDSIGVYLGIESGKGVVVAVPDKSQPFLSGDLDLKGLQPVKDAASEAELLAAAAQSFQQQQISLASGNAPNASQLAAELKLGEEQTEEQRAAEAEFKRGLYGTGAEGDSSGDDDDAASTVSSKKRVIVRIREKGFGSGTIDTSKLKEASRSLRLGELPTPRGRVPQYPSSGSLPEPPGTSGGASLPDATRSSLPPLSPAHVIGQGVATDPSGLAAPLWGPASQQSKPKTGGVPAKAVELGYAQPQYPPGESPPGSAAAQAGAPPGPALVEQKGGPPMGRPASGLAAGPTGSLPAALYSQGNGQPPLPGQYLGNPANPSDAYPTAQQSVPAPLPGGVLPPQGADGGVIPLQGLEQLASQDAVFGNGVPPQPPATATVPQEDPSPGLLSESNHALSEGSTSPLPRIDLPPFPGKPSATPASPGGSFLGALQPKAAPPPPGDLGALLSSTEEAQKPPGGPGATPVKVTPGDVPRQQPAAVCFKAGLVHLEENRPGDSISCLNEAFLSMAKDRSTGKDINTQARICAQYKVAALLLQEIAGMQRAESNGAVGARNEIARLSRQLASLPLQAKHRISCVRTAIRRNMEVQNYGYAKRQLDMLLAKAPPGKQAELRALVTICTQRGLSDRTIDGQEDPSKFCASTLGRLPTIGHDSCDTCQSNFSALANPGCPICGMGLVRRSDAKSGGSYPSPF